MPETALLVGAVPTAPQTITVNAAPPAQLSAGTYYLRHPDPSLSLIDAVEQLMDDEGVLGADVSVRQNLRVRISSLANFQLTLSGRLQRLLGFEGPLAGGQSIYDAPRISPLLWAPGYRATPTSRAGKAGYKVPHTTRHKSDDGSRQETQFFGEEVWQELEWDFIPSELLSVADGEHDGGTFEGFYEEVLKYGRPFHYYESIVTLPTTNAIGWTSSFGPYQLRDEIDPVWYRRIRSNTDDISGGVGLELHLVEEYSNA